MKETKEASLKENKDQAKRKQFYAHTSASVDHHFFCMWRMFVPFFCKYVALLPSNPTHQKKKDPQLTTLWEHLLHKRAKKQKKQHTIQKAKLFKTPRMSLLERASVDWQWHDIH